MPQTKLKRSLYIGLGGTGIKALLKTKKMFIDNYGEVPPMIQFLGFDTDKGVYEKKEKQVTDEVYLTKAEQCDISVPGSPIDYYNSNMRELNWLQSPNDKMIRNLDKGAGQVRTNGRLAFVYNVKNIETSIDTAYSKASSYHIVDNPTYAPAEGNVEVHIIFSIGGGTGCGTFLDVAYLIRKMYGKNVNLYGYAVLPKVFREMVPTGPAMMRVMPNAFGALQDLDYLMHLNQKDEPVVLNWISNHFSADDFRRCQTPFDMVYAIDNMNGVGVKYENVDNLADVISLALVAASGEIGTTNNSIFDNVIHTMDEGTLNVNDKKAWVASVGTSDIVFKGSEVADVYSRKVMLRIIDRSLNTGKDGNTLATNWIDENRIREDHGEDQVIDALCSARPKLSLDISDPKDPAPEVNNYCDSVLSEARKTAEKVKEKLLNEKPEVLKTSVSEYLKSGDYCVATTRDFIANVKAQILIFIDEMESEKEEFESKASSLKQKMDIAVKSLKEEANKSMLKRSKKRIEEYKDDTVNSSKNYVVNEIEIIRRLYAVQFFNAIIRELEAQENTVNLISELMQSLKMNTLSSLNKISASGRSTTMEIDLADSVLRNLSVDDQTLVFNDFYEYVGEGGLESVKTTEELESIILDYCKSRPAFEEWKNKTVSEVINTLSDEEFTEVCRRAVEKAQPLLKIDGKGKKVPNGLTLDQAIAHSYFICVEDRDNNRFKKSKNFQESIKSTQRIEYVSTGLKDRVIFYRQDFVVPAYAISGIDEWKREYDNSKVSCHFNELIHQRMVKDNYSIEPSDLDAELLSLWVKGLIFGLIKYDREIGHGSYTYLNKKSGKAANLFWVNTGTYYRDKAYENFCAQSKEAIEWFKNEIEEEKQKRGGVECQELCDVVTYGANYQLHFSQYDIAGYEEVPLNVLKENKRNKVIEKPKKIKNLASQEGSIALFMEEVEFVANHLSKEF